MSEIKYASGVTPGAFWMDFPQVARREAGSPNDEANRRCRREHWWFHRLVFGLLEMNSSSQSLEPTFGVVVTSSPRSNAQWLGMVNVSGQLKKSGGPAICSVQTAYFSTKM